ncbi:MAG: glycosyltransferase family 4 protein [Acidobacteria bacterium]|nr:glycosyltransferase family 4 protein [Acidobacteriota bacterium]
MRALQIGCVWPSEHGGGGDRVFADLAHHLPRQGVGLEALFAGVAAVESPLEATLSSFGAITDGTRARWLGARRAIAARVASGQFDLVASHFALYASAAIGWLRRVPHVVHFHGPWAAESRQEGAGRLSALAKWGIERSVYRSADRFIVLSEAFAALAARDYGVPAAQIRVVPGSADLDRFGMHVTRDEARELLDWPLARRALVSVRRLVRRTGVDRLIEAMPAVVARHPDVRLYVGGTGPLRPSLEQRVRQLGLDSSVVFLGYVPDERLPLVYRAADFNVMPTLALEGFGLTVVEALGAGTPSIVTPIGGLPEIVSPLAPDLVLRSTDVAEIARGINDALAGRLDVPDPRRCRSFATERFSADLMASRVADVYEEVAGR